MCSRDAEVWAQVTFLLKLITDEIAQKDQWITLPFDKCIYAQSATYKNETRAQGRTVIVVYLSTVNIKIETIREVPEKGFVRHLSILCRGRDFSGNSARLAD